MNRTIPKNACGAAVQTQGEGNTTTAHLNLTRSMADVLREEACDQLLPPIIYGKVK